MCYKMNINLILTGSIDDIGKVICLFFKLYKGIECRI